MNRHLVSKPRLSWLVRLPLYLRDTFVFLEELRKSQGKASTHINTWPTWPHDRS